MMSSPLRFVITFLAMFGLTVGSVAGQDKPKSKAKSDANLSKTTDDLKGLALAMHNYHDTFNRFPAVGGDAGREKGRLSWRVYLLPYVEQENLYRQFKMDEPWNSPHNKKLVSKMPEIYRPSNAKLASEGKTRIVVPVGADTLFPADGRKMHLRSVTDGTSNTIMLLEADDEHAVVWTKPDDLEIDMKKPLEGLAIRPQGGFLAVVGDGSLRFIRKTAEPKTVAAMFTRAGSELAMLRPEDLIELPRRQ